jgi:hypothetical protein
VGSKCSRCSQVVSGLTVYTIYYTLYSYTILYSTHQGSSSAANDHRALQAGPLSTAVPLLASSAVLPTQACRMVTARVVENAAWLRAQKRAAKGRSLSASRSARQAGPLSTAAPLLASSVAPRLLACRMATALVVGIAAWLRGRKRVAKVTRAAKSVPRSSAF